MFCTKCGSKLNENQRFCVKCGAKVKIRTSEFRATPQPETSVPLCEPSSRETAQAVLPPATMRSVRSELRVAGTTPPPAIRTAGAQLWLRVGLAVIVLGVAGYFGYGRLRHKTAHTPYITTQSDPSANAVTVGSEAANSSGEAATSSSLSTTPGTAEVTSSSTASAPISEIHKVDFGNFGYASDCQQQVNRGFDKAMRVSNGEWKKPSGLPGVDYVFSVASVAYGNLGPEGAEAAVVRTTCGGPFNFVYNEVYVFGMSPAGPKLLAHLSPSAWGAGEEDNGGFFQLADVQVQRNELAVDFYAGGSHAQPDRTDTASFQWRGNRLVRTGLTRKRFVQLQATANGQTIAPAAVPEASASPAKSSSQDSSGFNTQHNEGVTAPNAAVNDTAVTSQPPPQPPSGSAPHPPSTPPQPVTVQIPAGTTVEVQMIDPADSGVNRTGDILRASLITPIVVGNQIIATQTTDVYLRIFELHSYERSGRASEVRLVLDHFVNRGQSYSLFSSSFDVFGSGKGKAEVTGGISRGEQVHIAPGAKMSFQLTQPLNISVAATDNSSR